MTSPGRFCSRVCFTESVSIPTAVSGSRLRCVVSSTAPSSVSPGIARSRRAVCWSETSSSWRSRFPRCERTDEPAATRHAAGEHRDHLADHLRGRRRRRVDRADREPRGDRAARRRDHRPRWNRLGPGQPRRAATDTCGGGEPTGGSIAAWPALLTQPLPGASHARSRRPRRSRRGSAGGRTRDLAVVPWSAAAPSRPRANRCVSPGSFRQDRKSTRLNSSHGYISYAVFCLKKKKKKTKKKINKKKIKKKKTI